MITPSSSFPSSPSTSSTSSTDYTRSSSDDDMGIGRSGMNPPSSISDSSRPETLDRVIGGAHDTVDRLADKAKPQLERLQAGVDNAAEMGQEWAESLRTTVRDNPLAAVGTALALGLIVARLSR